MSGSMACPGSGSGDRSAHMVPVGASSACPGHTGWTADQAHTKAAGSMRSPALSPGACAESCLSLRVLCVEVLGLIAKVL